MAAEEQQSASEKPAWDPWTEEATGERQFLVGLDLGQSQDYTALTVVRQTDLYDGQVKLFLCNHVERFPLGTPYPDIVDSVVRLMKRPELQLEQRNFYGRLCTMFPTLVVDQTGVGRAVVNMFERAIDPMRGTYPNLEPVTIHGGRNSGRSEDGRGWAVSKIDLIGSVQAALGEGRLRIVRRLEHSETLKKELQDYRVRVSAAGHENYDARSGQHDDLVLALAMCIWFGEST
jgi:hypothetical protein